MIRKATKKSKIFGAPKTKSFCGFQSFKILKVEKNFK